MTSGVRAVDAIFERDAAAGRGSVQRGLPARSRGAGVAVRAAHNFACGADWQQRAPVLANAGTRAADSPAARLARASDQLVGLLLLRLSIQGHHAG